MAAVLAFARGVAVVSETCASDGLEVKLQMVEVGATVTRDHLHFLQDDSQWPDNHVLVVTDAGDL